MIKLEQTLIDLARQRLAEWVTHQESGEHEESQGAHFSLFQIIELSKYQNSGLSDEAIKILDDIEQDYFVKRREMFGDKTEWHEIDPNSSIGFNPASEVVIAPIRNIKTNKFIKTKIIKR